MVGIIVISESQASGEMLKTVCKVLNKKKLEGIKSVVFSTSYSFETRQNKLKKLVKQADKGDGVLIMTELYGASQTNVCKSFLVKGQIEVICGYNLPMLIEAASINDKSPLPSLCKQITTIGKKYIKCSSC